MHAVDTIQRLIGIDPVFAEEVEQLRLSIRNWPIEAASPGGRPGTSNDAQQAEVRG
jgi:hypothetical protein